MSKSLVGFFLLTASILFFTQCQQRLTPSFSYYDRPATAAPRQAKKRPVASKAAIVEESVAIAMPSLNEPVDIDSLWLQEAVPAMAGPFFPAPVLENTRMFYRQSQYKTKWLGMEKPFPLYYTLVELVETSAQYGLNPDDYFVKTLVEMSDKLYRQVPAFAEVAQLDVELTGLFFLYASHLSGGRMTATTQEGGIWKHYPCTSVEPTLLVAITNPEGLRRSIQQLHPADGQYAKLQAMLDRYRALDALYPESSLPAIRIEKTIDPGQRSDAIPAIRRRLLMTDLQAGQTLSDTSRLYDPGMVSAVRWFQSRHGLEPDGRIGENTVACLNISFREKAGLIALNMERLRWLPSACVDRRIVINIPEYTLRVYKGDTVDLEMRVVVGREQSATPVFTDTLRYIVFSPTWTVPHSIIQDEIIPRLKNNGTYYSSKGYRFYKNGAEIDPASETWDGQGVNPYAYQVVQQPGPGNALGRVKFIMPNSMSIYLHDTPSRSLFSRCRRAFSHGCIRLAEPARLAAYLLRNRSGWNDDMVYKKMHAETPETVFLSAPYQVQVVYFTAWVDELGLPNFREDIYGHDRHQLPGLLARVKQYASL